jgi:hypothetical protein
MSYRDQMFRELNAEADAKADAILSAKLKADKDRDEVEAHRDNLYRDYLALAYDANKVTRGHAGSY